MASVSRECCAQRWLKRALKAGHMSKLILVLLMSQNRMDSASCPKSRGQGCGVSCKRQRRLLPYKFCNSLAKQDANANCT